MSVRFDRKAREILEFIRAHPGSTTEDIDSHINVGRSMLKSVIFHLGTSSLIENRAEGDKSPQWYPIEIAPPSVYLSLANDLLKELDALPQDQRKAYLAKHLEAMMKAS